MNPDKNNVQVAVRIRPMIESELSQGCKNVLEVYSDLKQIKIKDSQLAFTYNYIYDTDTNQDTFYNSCAKDLLGNLFEGYNLTILAYGQTGSGKTYSMGTSYNDNSDMGIIPRAITDIFAYVNDNFLYDFTVTVSFMELYQETLYDLLAEKPREQSTLEIREDSKGNTIPGLREVTVTTVANTMSLLVKGSSYRMTASTNMNTQSSRSHAIFTLGISMQKKGDPNSNKTSKFHLVDLAGSERSKKTGATGLVFKEGVNINKGLLALGNVISALGDEKLQNNYICYRESNLTRLLKDSLGGNSITLMICCVSPADYNYQETVSTLRYADRARKIKNKPVVNQDPKAAEINQLKKLVQQLRMELVGQGGSVICQAELEQIRRELESLKAKNRELTLQLSCTLTEKTALNERIMIMQTANELMNKKLLELKDEYNITVGVLSKTFEENDANSMKEHLNKLHTIENLFTDLTCQVIQNEEEIRQHELRGSLIHSNGSDTILETELSSEQESHMKKQVAMNYELQEVTKMLAMKQHIAQQMIANNDHLVNYNNVAENEIKIQQLQVEKEELLKQLKDINTTGISSKLSEQRRLRVIDLEKQIQELQKKINGQARMIKLKEKDEQKIKLLNNEIQEMKQTKVKLIRTMKQETDRFNGWKLQRERELSKLKEQDRKRQNQIKQMENMHNRQQNVLRRKVEEAAAINKRLKDSLALRKNAQDQKNFGKVERLVPWVQQEVDIAVNTISAESTIANLLEERTALTKYLDQLSSNSEGCNLEQIKQTEDDIDIRSTQIRDLQQKILDSDQENKSKTRWDNVQSMGDAKFALKTLFDLTIESRLKDLEKDQKIAELLNVQDEVRTKLQEQDSNIRSLKTEHQRTISELNKEYEEKVCLLLRQLRGITVEGVEEQLQQQCSIQQDRIQQLEAENLILLEDSMKHTDEIDELKRRLSEINEQLQAPKNRKKSHISIFNKASEQKVLIKETEHDVSLNVTPDDPSDPDWYATPLAKRLRKFRNVSHTSITEQPRLTVKRSSEGACACKGNCSKRSCGCKKFGIGCSNLCKCSKIVCLNRDGGKENLTMTIKESSTIDDDSSQVSEDSYKKSRTLQDQNNTFEVPSGRTKRSFFIEPSMKLDFD